MLRDAYTGKLSAFEDFLRFEGEIPITIIFDRAGKELARTQGMVTKAGLIRQLEQLLKGSPGWTRSAATNPRRA